MSLMQKVTDIRRRRAIDRVIKTGKALRKAEASRRGIVNDNLDHTEVDARYLDRVIANLEKKRDNDLTFIKNTAPKES